MMPDRACLRVSLRGWESAREGDGLDWPSAFRSFQTQVLVSRHLQSRAELFGGNWVTGV